MARSTKEEAQETRTRILDAAVDVFYTRGVSHTSLADVAAAAGVTRGAIYWHFKNKGDLFDAMCEESRLPMQALLTSADEAAIDPLGQFRTWCLFALEEAVHNPRTHKIFDIIIKKCEFVDPTDPIYIRKQECFIEGRMNIQRSLRLAVDKEQLPPNLDLELAAVSVQALIFGSLANWLFVTDSFDMGAHTERLADLCIHMLKTAPSLQKN